MKRKLRINGHSHLLPYPEEIPEFMKEKEIFWVDDERKHMLQKGWSRPVTHSSFFLDEKLEWMDQNKIDHAVEVLNSSKNTTFCCPFSKDVEIMFNALKDAVPLCN